MLIQSNLLILLTAHKFFEQLITFDQEGFKKSLSSEVQGEYDREKEGNQNQPVILNNVDQVIDAYSKSIFKATRSYNKLNVSYQTSDLQATIHYQVNEDKTDEEGFTERYQIDSTIVLGFSQKGDELKISRIWEQTSKNAVDLELT